MKELFGKSKQINYISGTDIASSNWIVNYTYWNKYMAENNFTEPMYRELFISPTNDTSNFYTQYWLASRVIQDDTTDVTFGMYGLNLDTIGIANLYSSNEWPTNRMNRLRPIITLNSDVQLNGKTGDVWNLK